MSHIRIFTSGGMISPGELLTLTGIARESGCRNIGLGSRQELYLTVEASRLAATQQKLQNAHFRYDTGEKHFQNLPPPGF
jgi:sulfite reductase beta subunit-like hemoprotein